VAATAGDASISVSFAAPTSDGGAAITGYTASCSASGVSRTATGAASPLTVGGLANGVTYACTVLATNAVGSGSASAAVSATPAVAAKPPAPARAFTTTQSISDGAQATRSPSPVWR